MSLRRILILMGATCVIVAPPLWGWKQLSSARAEYASAQTHYNATVAQARRIVSLRAEQEQVADRKRPEEYVLAQVNRVLADAGISSRLLQNVRPEADTALPSTQGGDGPQYRRQSVALSLREITIPQVGAFLARWREENTLWTPHRIELNKHRTRDDFDDRYNASIVLSTIYVADSTP